MPSDHSISAWIVHLKNGDEGAATALWEACFHQLCAYARKRLGETPCRVGDEEDLALSALNALFIGAREGRFRKLENRTDLWQLLAVITARKVANFRRQEQVRQELGESVFFGIRKDSLSDYDDLLAVEQHETFASSLTLSCEELISGLDDRLRDVALLKLAGYTNEEIAKQKERSVRTIERYVQMIRLSWEESSNLT